jgi:hypothetical protein
MGTSAVMVFLILFCFDFLFSHADGLSACT